MGAIAQPVYDFLATLAGKGVKLSLDGDRLHCYAQPGIVTEDMSRQIVRLRPQIVDLLRATASTPAAEIVPQRLGLSAGQKGLYVLHGLRPESSTYNVPICFRGRGGLQRQHLARAWTLVQQQFPILTARILDGEAGPYHLFDPDCVTALQVETVAIEDDHAFLAFLQARARKPFDLARGPLTRPELFLRPDRDATLLITVHHIVIDGVSSVILLRALFAHYQALAAGRSPMPAASGQGYGAFVAWEEAMLLSPEGQAHAQYWRTRLAGVSAHVNLPALSNARQAATGGSEMIAETLPAALELRIATLSRQTKIPPSAIFLAAFHLLLHRLTGQDDLVLTMPVMGRAGGRFRDDIGYFINMAPLRSMLEASGDFLSCMQQAQRTMMDAIYHAPYPLSRIVGDVNLSGAHAGGAFRILYAYQNVLQLRDVSASEYGGSAIEMVAELVQEGAGDLELVVFAQNGGHTLDLKYQTTAIDTPMARKLLGHLLVLLDAAVTDPHRPVLKYPVLDEAEYQQVLNGFNATRQVYPQADLLIHQLFEAQAAVSPDRIAVSFDGAALTYGELEVRANRLAHHLAGLGAAPERCVAVFMERSLDLVVALLAVLKTGGAYVPVDPDYPAARIADMLEDSAPMAVLTCTSLRAALPPLEVAIVAIDGDAAAIATHGGGRPDIAGLTPETLAYVIYTSGSTGRPKGAMNAHRAVVNRLLWMQARYDLRDGDRVLQKTPFGFDVSVWEFFWPLLAGATLVVAPPGLHKDPDALADLIEASGVTMLHFVPSMLRVFLDQLSQGRCGSIRQLFCSGEELPVALLQRCRNALPRAALANLYGPTEAAIDVTYWDCDGGEALRVPIGRPIGNVRLYVLDPLGVPVPIGVPGELFIGGVAVGRGYLNRPELTAERFVASPFVPGERLYKTGDLARWLADGSIDYLGRNDFQVKIRGFRIELGEIEARLSACEAIREAVVLAREDVPGDKRLVAYVITADDAAPDLDALRAQLSAGLPHYMVPAAYVRLDRLPLTSSGKLDRNALPAPDDAAYASCSYEAPSGDEEMMLAAIWSEILGVERIGVHDDFFALGGHSLLATRLVALLREKAGVEMPLRDVFEAATLRAQAERVAVLRSREAAVDVPPLVPMPHLPHAVMSYAQQRLWFLDQLDHAAGAAYHMPAALRLQGRLDAVALRAALDGMVARHEILRTRFVRLDGEAVQAVGPRETRFSLIEDDLTALSEADRTAAVAASSEVEAISPFDMSTGPMIRGRLLRLSADAHVLLLTQHHIVSDGWSIGIMIRELASLYASSSTGEGEPLPALPVQYADYAIWQRDWLRGEVLQRQLAFWKAHLSGAPVLLDLPLDRRRPARQEYAGRLVKLALPASLVAGLRGLSQRHGVTLFMTLLAGWSLMMSRLSGQTDVVIGTVVANRRFAALDPLIGFFVNTLAVRVRLDAATDLASLLAQVKTTMLDTYAHQDVPFEQVVEAVQPPRSLSHSPIFQTMVALDNTLVSTQADMPGLTVVPMAQEQVVSQFDLGLALSETDGMLTGGLEYASSLFDHATVERMVAYLVTLLSDMVENEASPLPRLNMLPTTERNQLIEDFNATRQVYPQADLLIHQLFEAQALRHPEAVALCYGDAQLSYGELDLQANRLAHHLIALGVVPGCRVAIHLERGLAMVVALLAVLKTGGAYVPVDPDYPAARIADMLEDSAPMAVLTCTSLRAALPPLEVAIVAIDGDAAAIAAHGGGRPDIAGLTPETLAYVIYTSGSTGRPKGAMNAHRAVVNRLLWMQARYDLRDGDRVLQKTPFGFDVSIPEFFQPLLAGATLVVAPPGLHKDPDALADLIEASGVTMLHFVPSMLRVFLDQLSQGRCGSIRQLFCSGEELPVALLQRCRNALPRAAITNLYGPTETAIEVTYWDCDGGEALRVPIGRPIGNVRLYVLDPLGVPVPIGVPGELFIGGVAVGRGYLNRPELTAERFVASPFVPGERLYKTGDLARWLADGSIDYLGRNDFQVKIRGFRIELGEIEARLSACEAIREAVVLAREDVPGDKRLVAYVITADDAAPDLDALRAQLSAGLPHYMVPAAYVRLDRLPLTSSGKLDRNALPAPDDAAYASCSYEAPSGDEEMMLAAIWSEILGVERIGVHDDFFALGGHSLLATRLVALLREKAGVEMPLRDVFEAATLRAQAERVAVLRSREAAVDVPPLVPMPHLPHAVMSYAQQRLWFLDQLDHAAGAAYHMPAALRLQGRLDAVALRAALDGMVARHEILRTRFVRLDGEAVQAVGPRETRFSLIEDDLTALSEADRTAAVAASSEVEAISPFDMSTGPMIRGRLLRLSADAHVLLLTQHHIVSDGWSIGIMIRELASLYASSSTGEGEPLPALPVQYADYAIWQRDWLRGEVLQRQLAFWKAHLSGAPVLLDLPLDRRRPARQEYAGRLVKLALPASLVAGLRGLSQRHGVTLFMTLLAGWSLMMSRLSGQTDVVIGTVVANRRFAALDPLIGFFVNTLAVRVRLDAATDLASLLAQVKTTMLDTYAHQDVPFEQVVEAVQPPRSLSHSPIFQTMVALDNTLVSTQADMPGLTVVPMAQEQVVSQFDLGLALSETDGMLTGGLEYASSLFDHATVERMVAYLMTLLSDMVENEASPLPRLNMLPTTERNQLIEDFNAAEYDVPPSKPLFHCLFERQAAQAPEREAVRFEDASISYGELNARSNRLAHRLRALGLGAEDRVVICVRRSPSMVMAVLSVLKAGAAYVPIDPTTPAERIAHILTDSAPALMLYDSSTSASLRCSAGSGSVVCLDLDDDRDWRDLSADNPASPPDQDDRLAYVIYTSGTTGNAKGVMVEQGQLAAMRSSWQALYGLEEGMRHLQMASFAFDVCTGDLCRTLTSGGCLVLCPRKILMDGAALFRLMAREKIAFGDFVPSVLHQLMNHLENSGRTLPALRVVVCGADMWPMADAVRLQALADPNVRQYHSYGVTEATVDSAYFDTGRADLLSCRALPVGRAMPHVRLYLLNDALEPVPVGVLGELYIGGAGVARGYLNRPALTQERFLPDPFVGDRAARMYKTGDLGRWLGSGNIEYVGRNDFQVKIRGFRVELGEIEANLANCAGIGDAVVLVREDVAGEKRLVAYVLTVDNAAPDIELLRGALAEKLPHYMVPNAYVHLAVWPWTANGKLDRRALPAPDSQAFASRRYEAPSGDEEVTLAAIWSEILGVERIGVHDDFFALGGHSLLAVQVMARIKQHFGRSLPLAALFQYPDIANLARALTKSESSSADVLVPIQPQGAGTPIFAVPGAGGNVLSFVWLSAALDEHRLADGLDAQPFYALQAVGLDGLAPPLTSVEATAAVNIKALRAIQDSGPYCLAGHSYGGLIAYEMARQLVAAGETISALLLLDSIAPQVLRHAHDDEADLLHQLQAAIGRMFPGRTLDLDVPALLAMDHAHRAAAVADVLDREGLPADPVQLTAFFDVFQAHMACYQSYNPAPLADHVPVTLLRIHTHQEGQLLPEDYGWETPLARAPVIKFVEGDHMSMLERAHAAGLAAAIAEPADRPGLQAPVTPLQDYESVRQPAYSPGRRRA